MYTKILLHLALALPALSTPTPLTTNATLPLSLRMSLSILSRAQGLYPANSTTFDASITLQANRVQKAFALVSAYYPSSPWTPSLETYINESAASLLPLFENATAALKYPLDRLGAGDAYLSLSAQTGGQEYKNAAEVLADSVRRNPRTDDGGLWYFVYPYWSYLDGMASFGPFWAAYTISHQEKGCECEAWRDLKRQFELLARRCEKGDGLLVHGYDDSRTAVWADQESDQSPFVWGRSLGWWVVGVLETLVVLDQHEYSHYNSTAVREECAEQQDVRSWLLEEFRKRMRAVVEVVDGSTGAWWQIVDLGGREGNYVESSASAMFVYALLRGVREGYLTSTLTSTSTSTPPTQPGSNYTDIALRAYAYLKETFVVENSNGTLGWNGTVGVCSLNSTASYEYYVQRPIVYNSVLGSTAFVAASVEVERLSAERT